MPDESLTEKLGRYLSSLQFEQIPSDVVNAAKMHVLDSLGCLLAGSRLEAGRLAYELAVATSGANSTSSHRTAAKWTISTAAPELVSAP
jgi:2-methylcitrate dehydratase PrpD